MRPLSDPRRPEVPEVCPEGVRRQRHQRRARVPASRRGPARYLAPAVLRRDMTSLLTRACGGSGLGRTQQAEEFLSMARWNVQQNPDCGNEMRAQLYR